MHSLPQRILSRSKLWAVLSLLWIRLVRIQSFVSVISDVRNLAMTRNDFETPTPNSHVFPLRSILSPMEDPERFSNQGSRPVDRRAMLRHSVTAASALVASSSVMASLNPNVANAVTSYLPKNSLNTIPSWTLANNVQFPLLALNTVGLSPVETEIALRLAVKEGITHVDFHPGKERDGVAQYLQSYSRDHLFLNTKIRKAPPGTSPKEAAHQTLSQIDQDLKALGLDSVDMLMLRDSPDEGVIQAQWAILEQALAEGKTRSIGVVNFCENALGCLLKTATILPAVNYHLLHVGMGKDAHGLRTFQESRGIRTFAYGAVGEPGPNPRIIHSPILKRMGDAHGGKTPEEVALRWLIQGGCAVSVRPTSNFDLGVSACPEDDDGLCQSSIRARARTFSWSLTDDEMKELNDMTSPDDNPTLFSSSGCPGAFVLPK